jgi:DNA-binding transcriptional LysR family regulator
MADRRLRVFHAVAKHLSFTKAADALFMTQPAVTFQVRQLEEHFATRLFDRAQGRIVLTAAGVVAFEYAERILALDAELDARVREMTGHDSGPLLIGASTTLAEFLLPQVRRATPASCRGSSWPTPRRCRNASPSAASTWASSRATRTCPPS